MKYVAREINRRPGAASEETRTYGEDLTWFDDERWELIDGVPYNMAPVPSRFHQGISGKLFRQFANYLEGKAYEIYAAPFVVRLPAAGETDAAARVRRTWRSRCFRRMRRPKI